MRFKNSSIHLSIARAFATSCLLLFHLCIYIFLFFLSLLNFCFFPDRSPHKHKHTQPHNIPEGLPRYTCIFKVALSFILVIFLPAWGPYTICVFVFAPSLFFFFSSFSRCNRWARLFIYPQNIESVYVCVCESISLYFHFEKKKNSHTFVHPLKVIYLWSTGKWLFSKHTHTHKTCAFILKRTTFTTVDCFFFFGVRWMALCQFVVTMLLNWRHVFDDIGIIFDMHIQQYIVWSQTNHAHSLTHVFCNRSHFIDLTTILIIVSIYF